MGANDRLRRRRPGGLGELPADKQDERDQQGRRILSPGSGAVTDWINRYTLSLFPFTVGTTALRIVPANELRTYLIIQNKSAGTIFVNFGQNPTQFASIQIEAGGNYIFEGGAFGGEFIPVDDVYVLGSAAGLDGVVGEGLILPVAR